MKKNVASVRADKTLIELSCNRDLPDADHGSRRQLVFFVWSGYAGAMAEIAMDLVLGSCWPWCWFPGLPWNEEADMRVVYGLALAAATGLMTSRMVTPILGFWVLLGLTWWCCHH